MGHFGRLLENFSLWENWVSPAVIRTSTERAHIPFASFPPVTTSLLTIKQYHSRETDMDTIHRPYSDSTSFTCTCACVCVCVYAQVHVFSPKQFYHMCRFVYSPPQSRDKTVPSPQGSLVLFFCNCTHFPPALPLPSSHFLTTTNLFSISVFLILSRTLPKTKLIIIIVMLHKWNPKVCNLLRLAFFTQHNLPGDSSKLFPVSIVNPFYGWIVSYVMDVPQSV